VALDSAAHLESLKKVLASTKNPVQQGILRALIDRLERREKRRKRQ
jgi:uncharacterized protein (UPF0335 family)